MRHAPLRTPCRAACVALAAIALAACGGHDEAAAPTANAEQACAALAGKTLAGAAIAAATTVAATTAEPLYCKVSATIAPQLHLELRLPQQWNGKLYHEGGGGYNGAIPPLRGLALKALQQGYATVHSDSGHTGDGLSAAFALNDPLAASLFGHAAVPAVSSSAREMVRAAYGKAPDKAYFEGCSEGGREALMAAQRNPGLFDGIIARAPGYNWTGFMGHWNRNAKSVAAPGGQFSAAKLGLLAQAVRAACDANDGIADGIVSHPQACRFDPAVLRCAGGADGGDTCLSDAQLAVVQSRTSSASFADGAYTSAPLALNGQEDDPVAGWEMWVTGAGNVRNALHFLFQDTTVKNYLARDPAQDSLVYAFASDPTALHTLSTLNDATDADLRPFQNRNARLILWHGGSDPSLSPQATTDYHQAVTAAVGGQAAADAFMRYYIAPGVGHCEGGPGADQTDLLGPLDAWVTAGTAPGTLSAAKVADGTVQASRPLCRFPQYPRYTGPANDAAAAALAANYTCTMP